MFKFIKSIVASVKQARWEEEMGVQYLQVSRKHALTQESVQEAARECGIFMGTLATEMRTHMLPYLNMQSRLHTALLREAAAIRLATAQGDFDYPMQLRKTKLRMAMEYYTGAFTKLHAEIKQEHDEIVQDNRDNGTTLGEIKAGIAMLDGTDYLNDQHWLQDNLNMIQTLEGNTVELLHKASLLNVKALRQLVYARHMFKDFVQIELPVAA